MSKAKHGERTRDICLSEHQIVKLSEQAKREIEAFAPSLDKDERDVFYPKLRKAVSRIPAPTEAADKIPDGYIFVLSNIWVAYLRFKSQDACNRYTERMEFARSGAQLSKEQVKIVKELEKIQNNPNVRSLHFELYYPAEVRCPHRRFRKECERLSVERTKLLLWNQSPTNRLIGRHLTELNKVSGHLLERNAGDFCEPSALPPPPPSIVLAGRRRDALIDFLMREIVFWLVPSGWQVTKATTTLGDLLRLFFGIECSPDALKKRYERLGPGTKSLRRSSSPSS